MQMTQMFLYLDLDLEAGSGATPLQPTAGMQWPQAFGDCLILGFSCL
jgi:hypothetical protein